MVGKFLQVQGCLGVSYPYRKPRRASAPGDLSSAAASTFFSTSLFDLYQHEILLVKLHRGVVLCFSFFLEPCPFDCFVTVAAVGPVSLLAKVSIPEKR